MTTTDVAYQQCISPRCGAVYNVAESRIACERCGELLDVRYDWDRLQPPDSLRQFERMWSRRNERLRFSGVWRFHELLPFAAPEHVVSVGEGQTLLQQAEGLRRQRGALLTVWIERGPAWQLVMVVPPRAAGGPAPRNWPAGGKEATRIPGRLPAAPGSSRPAVGSR